MTQQSEIPISIAAPAILAGYEELRRQALHKADPMHRGAGLALFVRQGMRSWMQAWSRCRPSVPSKPQIKTSVEQVSPIQGSRELVSILASMALGSRQEAR